MSPQPLFAGLIFDEQDRPVPTAMVGTEPCYVVDDAGFLRHIPTAQVDRQVLEQMRAGLRGHEEIASAEAARMLGQDDPFSRAMIGEQLKNINQYFDQLLETGLPEELRAYLGMLGFKIIINVHGEVVRLDQPAAASDEGE